MQVCEDWFTRMRMLLLRTSAASNSPHLTLHHAFARLADLKAQLRHLQAAAAVEAAQQLQEQLQAQRQQAQLIDAESEAAEQALEPRAHPMSPSPSTSAVTIDSANIDHLPSSRQSVSSQRQGRPYQPHLQPDHFKPGSPGAAPSAGQGSPAQQPQSGASPSAGAVLAPPPASAALAPTSLFRPDPVKSDRAAPLGLLEIQAEQEAEAARAAETAAARPSHGRGSHQASAKQAPSPVSDAPAQRGQSRVLQVIFVLCALSEQYCRLEGLLSTLMSCEKLIEGAHAKRSQHDVESSPLTVLFLQPHSVVTRGIKLSPIWFLAVYPDACCKRPHQYLD